MHRYLFLFLFQLCFLGLNAQQDSAALSAQAYLSTVVAEGNCMGIAAGISTKGAVNWRGGAGLADSQKGVDFTPTTLNRTASISKPMTAVAIMQLQEKEKLQLDDFVSEYLPAFATEDKAQITIRQVLQHAAGIRAYANKKEGRNTIHYPTLEAALQIFLKDELLFTPGTDFSYTSYGYVVLGLVIEAASGKSYEEYLQTNIWDPAGMSQTSVEQYGLDYPKKAALYHQRKPGKVKAATTDTDLSDRIPGGGIQSTVTDLLKFGEALLQGTLLQASSLQEMTVDSGLKLEGNPYGLGWFLYGKNPERNDIFGHSGAQMGTSSLLLLFPKRESVVVVLTNTSGAQQQIWYTASGLTQVASSSWWKE